MSVSDPAPLPRLGEVFFDVRGNSRSMRLSWYADTGVAVFSIWQAGMCTGTFRLPIADLNRMIETLQRGPSPRRRGPAPVISAERDEREPVGRSGEYRRGEDDSSRGSADISGSPGYAQGDFTADIGLADYRADADRPAAAHPDYGSGEYRAAGQVSGEYRAAGQVSGEYRAAGQVSGEYRAAGYGSGEYRAAGHGSGEYRTADYGGGADGVGYSGADNGSRGGSGGYGAAGYGGGDEGSPGLRSGEYRPAGYDQGQYAIGGDYQPGSYEPPGYVSGDYGRAPSDHLSGDYATGGFGAERRTDPAADYRGDDSFAAADPAGYHDDRFAPPYHRGQPEAYLNDNAGPGPGYLGDIGGPAYPADRRRVSPADDYPEEADPQAGYSYDAEYRYR